MEALQTREPLFSEGLGEPLREEKVIAQDLDEIPKLLAVQNQLSTVRRKPRLHPDGLSAQWATGPFSDVAGLGLFDVDIVSGPKNTFFQNEEVWGRRGLRTHEETS
ncbi:hypothetical protein [Archangium lipolyticum]|uniref:hypothetical protein n=1 Tax=Archangium lipolyticum TaxID=2970465 RepID=UPI00214A648B|nr:hypothetical protein [Archangium lipolyticum]